MYTSVYKLRVRLIKLRCHDLCDYSRLRRSHYNLHDLKVTYVFIFWQSYLSHLSKGFKFLCQCQIHLNWMKLLKLKIKLLFFRNLVIKCLKIYRDADQQISTSIKIERQSKKLINAVIITSLEMSECPVTEMYVFSYSLWQRNIERSNEELYVSLWKSEESFLSV